MFIDNSWYTYIMNCIHGKQTYVEGKWYCYYCGKEVISTPKSIVGYKVDGKRRRPMTEYEKMKLGWYRDEKKWIENIKSRQIVYKNGQKATVIKDEKGNIRGEMPSK